MEQILVAFGFPEETVTAIMMLYTDSKAIVRSLDGDSDFFYIDAGILQGDTFVLFLFIIRLDCIIKTSIDLLKETFSHTKKQSVNDILRKLFLLLTT